MKTNKNAPGNGRFFLPLWALILVACSSTDPEIMQTEVRLIDSYYPFDAVIEHRLSVAIDIHDSDGAEDVEKVRVLLPTRRLEWERNVEQLRRYDRDGRRWFVADDLSVPVPNVSGPLVLFVEDKSQRTTEAQLVIPPIESVGGSDTFPVMVVSTNEINERPPEADRYETAVEAEARVRVPPRTDLVYLIVRETDGRLGAPVEIRVNAQSEVVLPDSLVDRVGGRSFYLLNRISPTQWRESGPWVLATR